MLAGVRGDDVPPGFFWFFFLFVMVLGIGGLVLWIWALVDCIRVPDDRYYRSGTKLVWVLVIALLQAIGAIVYLAAGRPEKAVRQGWGSAPPPQDPSASRASAPIPPPPPPN